MHVASILAVAAALVAIPALASAAGETHPFNVRDLVSFDRIVDSRVSPDGKWIVFQASTLDLEGNRRKNDLWLVASEGGVPRRLTSAGGDSSPRWQPDGKAVWFLSSRSGSSQVWKIAVDGGEAQPVTKLPLDVGAFALSRDGAKLLVAMEVFPDCDTLACTKKRLEEQAAKKATGRIYDKLMIRHWDSWFDGRRSHVFVMPAAAGGEPVDLMKGMDADGPTKPFGGDEEFAFTPDGKGVVFTAKDEGGSAEAWSTNSDLWLAPADGSAKPQRLTASNKATDTQPIFSPDGKTLAWLAMARPGFEADRYRIVLRDWPSGKDRVLTESWDRSPNGIAWSPDGKEIWCSANNLGQQSLFAVEVATGKVRPVVEKGWIGNPMPAGGRVVFPMESLRSPVELYSVKADGSDVRKITDVNREKLAAVRMGETEQFTFKGAGGDTVHAYLIKPADFDPSKKYPVAFLIHGGPQGSMANEFHYRWNPQTYAGAGYAALTVDFHGSTGYGQAFTDAIRDDWGGKPLEDLQKGLDAALAKYPFLDGTRVAALGASYGGYMINWIAGKWPDRFRCLVAHDGNLDERAAYYMTEELWFPEWEHGGTPWENPQGYEKHNPLSLVGNWKTPILVVHGGRDFRIVDSQGFATFTAAQRRGIPSKLLHFPDENHWVLKPQNSILWHDTVIGWLDRWTKK